MLWLICPKRRDKSKINMNLVVLGLTFWTIKTPFLYSQALLTSHHWPSTMQYHWISWFVNVRDASYEALIVKSQFWPFSAKSLVPISPRAGPQLPQPWRPTWTSTKLRSRPGEGWKISFWLVSKILFIFLNIWDGLEPLTKFFFGTGNFDSELAQMGFW